MMNWDETIKHVRGRAEFSDLIYFSYLSEDLKDNVERYKASEEYAEVMKLITNCRCDIKKILDVGSGNGISAVSFALDGFNVVAVEPDKSKTVGAGAIKILKRAYSLNNLRIIESIAEEADIKNEDFDMVFVRQALHHASDLDKFVRNITQYLKKDGLFIAVREHVIFDEKDKQIFLKTHPLNRFYGGENAFTKDEYLTAFKKAGLNIVSIFRYFDSVINFFPMSSENAINIKSQNALGKILKKLAKILLKRKYIMDERDIPGRMYSFIAVKK